VIQFFFFEIFKERVKNTRTNERKRGVFFIEKKKKKKEESKFFTRTLSHKESLCLFVSFESESEREREKERVERWSKGTSKGPVRSFVLSRKRLSGGAVLVSKAFESQVFLTRFPSSFFFPLS
jgi:hypothetical protein